MCAKKFEDMTEAEKKEAYDKWVSSRTARRAQSGVKREAVKQLIKMHESDYNALLTKLGGKPAAK